MTYLGIRYTSKLDEFESFVEKTRKYGLIPASFAGESKSSVILLIDDLPLTNGNTAYRKLCNCLQLLAQSTQIPTVILITDYGTAGSAENIATARCLEELQLSLENVGACKVASVNQVAFLFPIFSLLNAHFKLVVEISDCFQSHHK